MKKIVLFLHGYGSNGSDLITLKDYFHLNQLETEFISPNAPEPCEFNYFGYQWFALNERSVEEIQTGLKSAFFYLDDIVNDIKSTFPLTDIFKLCIIINVPVMHRSFSKNIKKLSNVSTYYGSKSKRCVWWSKCCRT